MNERDDKSDYDSCHEVLFSIADMAHSNGSYLKLGEVVFCKELRGMRITVQHGTRDQNKDIFESVTLPRQDMAYCEIISRSV